ncbi:hypothetical protein LJC56_11960, partial [Christensenellaceae bacterium OttesenSCG-928-K19]|nr:hypothetical protein [Christensenellaceae bacterium OttesenSCG-928-K19]
GRKRAASVFALFEYEVEGKTYRQEFCVDTIVPPDVGSTLTIGYDPDNPERIYLRSGRGYMVFYIIAAVFAVVGIAMLITQ